MSPRAAASPCGSGASESCHSGWAPWLRPTGLGSREDAERIRARARWPAGARTEPGPRPDADGGGRTPGTIDGAGWCRIAMIAPRSGILTSSAGSRTRKRKETAEHPGMVLGPANQKRRSVLTNQSQGLRVTYRPHPHPGGPSCTDRRGAAFPVLRESRAPAPGNARAPGPRTVWVSRSLGRPAGLLVHHGRPRPPRPGLRPRPPRGACLPSLWAEHTFRSGPSRAPCACRTEVCGRAVGGEYPAVSVELRTAWRVAAVPRSAVHTATHAAERRENTK